MRKLNLTLIKRLRGFQMIDSSIQYIQKKIKRYVDLDLLYYSKNGFWIGLQQIVMIITGLALSVVFTRMSTQETYGYYQYVLAVLAIISIVSIPGLNSSVIQSVARGYHGDYNKSVRFSFLWSLIGIPALLIIGLYYYHHNPVLGASFMMSSIFFPFFYAPNTWNSFLLGQARFNLSIKYSLIQSIINTLSIISTILIFPNNLPLIITVYLFSYSIFNIYWYRRSQRLITNNNIDKESVPYGCFLTKINILNIVTNQLDKILIGVFLTPVDLAVYGVGTALASKFYDFFKSLLSMVTVKSPQKNILKTKNLIFVFIAFTIITTFLYILFPIVIPLLYTTKYSNSISLSQIVILFLPVYVLALLYKSHLVFFLRDKSILIKESMLLAILRVVTMIPLLIFFKMIGLAVSVGLQHVIEIILLYYFFSLKKLPSGAPRLKPQL